MPGLEGVETRSEPGIRDQGQRTDAQAGGRILIAQPGETGREPVEGRRGFGRKQCTGCGQVDGANRAVKQDAPRFGL